MQVSGNSCYQCVDEGNTVKNGKTKNGKQRYLCKNCGKTFLTTYTYNGCHPSMDSRLKELTKEGVGIRSSSRILKISTSTVINKILRIAAELVPPVIGAGKVFEMDEMCTYVGRKDKLTWIAYAICVESKEVVGLFVGRRTNKTLRKVVSRLILLNPKEIFTDKLKNYRYIIPENIHCTKRHGTNNIECKNTALRAHLKRLNRRTICYSKSIAMLVACLKIYFWA